MFSIKQLPEFTTWLSGLKDRVTSLRLAKRLDKAQRGMLGDVKLGGGDKSTQSADIAKAVKLAATLEE